MKKILTVLLFMFGAFTVSMAQTTFPMSPTSVSKQDKATLAAQKKADSKAKALAKIQAKEANSVAPVTSTSVTHLNKNGTPDKRFKANQQPAVTPPVQARVSTPAPAQTQAIAAPSKVIKQAPQIAQPNTVKTADKAIGTDAQGRTIYQGSRGGKYYINKEGHKEYVK